MGLNYKLSPEQELPGHSWALKTRGTGGGLHAWRCGKCGLEHYSSGFPYQDNPFCATTTVRAQKADHLRNFSWD